MRGTRRLILLAAASTIVFGLLATTPASAASKEKILYNFCSLSNCADGAVPSFDGLTFDASGNLYGMTEFGGDGCPGDHPGCGTAYELTPGANGTWTETVLYNFCEDPKHCVYQQGNLTLDATGNLYGTAGMGGASVCYPQGPGCGVVFQLKRGAHGQWQQKILHNFQPNGKDGIYPSDTLLIDAAGNLYGTTGEGGTGSCSDGYESGCGTVFELVPSANGKWTEKVLYSFKGTDGYGPQGNLISDAAGNLYGTTYSGGNGAGVVFELTHHSGERWKEKVLHVFSGHEPDGAEPVAGLTFGPDGSLYGTTVYGGAYDGGTVFQLTRGDKGAWVEQVLHSFQNNGKDGYGPWAGVAMDKAGNLYGTTSWGGGHSSGTVFELTPGTDGKWREKVLHSFDNNGKDGTQPTAGVILDGEGNLYGTTTFGGPLGCYYGLGCGIVFEITP